MDNDNKIEKDLPAQTHKEVLLFLKDELKRIQQTNSTQSYDLEEEYEKTKSHKSPFTAIVLAISFLVVGGVAVIMNTVINRHNEEITVNLQDFDDLNLQNLLNSVTKVQTNYENAVKAKSELEKQCTEELTQVEFEKENSLFLIDSMKLSEAQKDINKQSVLASYKKNVSNIHLKYDAKIATAQKEVDEYTSQLAEFDNSKIAAAREQEKMFEAERQIQEMERQKIVDSYETKISELQKSLAELRKRNEEELRNSVKQVKFQYEKELQSYDPVLDDNDANNIIEENNQIPVFNENNYAETQIVYDSTAKKAINDFQQIYNDYDYLDSQVKKLPYKNSVANYRNTSKSLVDKMGNLLADATTAMAEEKNQLKEQIVGYEEQISDYEQQIAEVDEQIDTENQWFEDCLEGVLVYSKTNSIVLQVNSESEIAVFVAKKARYLIDPEKGVPAEIKTSKPLKGTIFRELSDGDEPGDDDYFYFVPETPIEKMEDYGDLGPGIAIKLISK